MTTLTIEIPDKVEKTLADLIEQLGGKVIATGTSKKLSKAAKKKQQILDDLVKLHQEGKVKAKPIQQLLNEL
jgi:cysteine synthase